MENETLMQVMMWAIGICATGFFFLAMWIRQLTDRHILSEIKEIRIALVGDIDRPGIITVIHQHENEIKYIKGRCKELHPTVA
jgi:hypothetical protein